MESESSRGEEETPSLMWGLDPVFLAFAKLYVRDILDLKESCQVPGIFFYNGHPIKQVDILGTVIGVKEKNTFYSYGERKRERELETSVREKHRPTASCTPPTGDVPTTNVHALDRN
uniref:STN1 subunit of CST complex n=1 Tax=Pipistrellus kuhlii TaxID=59472 RepID=A0A7J7VCL9_PIPKU|nr:STN1 subunit of CST complex [Pipistrellus kuhlii]